MRDGPPDGAKRRSLMSNMAQMGLGSGLRRGDLEDARRFAALIPLFQELGDRHRVNMVKSELAHIERHEGHLDNAESAYRETILQWKRLGHRAAVAHQLESFAFIAHRREDRLRAARLYGAAESLRERSYMTPMIYEYDGCCPRFAAMTDDCGSPGWKAMTLEQAVALRSRPRRLVGAGFRAETAAGDCPRFYSCMIFNSAGRTPPADSAACTIL
jgi:hypothetical protein